MLITNITENFSFYLGVQHVSVTSPQLSPHHQHFLCCSSIWKCRLRSISEPEATADMRRRHSLLILAFFACREIPLREERVYMVPKTVL